MTDYTKAVNFATKDALITGDPLKIVKGTEINTELDNLAASIATKFDKAGGTITGVTSITAALTSTSSLNLARGSIVQNATTMDLWALPNTLDGTGVAVIITAITNAPQAGARRVLYPIAGTTITNNAMFAVDGGANYTTSTGDYIEFESVTTSTYKVHVINSIGINQTWQDVKASRALATTYTNTTGKPISVQVAVNNNTANAVYDLTVGGVLVNRGQIYAANANVTLTAIVPNNVAYSLTSTGGVTTFVSWAELR